MVESKKKDRYEDAKKFVRYSDGAKMYSMGMTKFQELDMDPLQVYRTYHNLWKIEESYHITKSYLDARLVYVQKKKQSTGIF